MNLDLRHRRFLRNNPTKAEYLLWFYLKNKNINGNKFRRQHRIDNFIVDFVCLKKKLVVEVDGGQHARQASYDAFRARRIQAKGFKLLRFWNNEVLGHTEAVVENIKKALE